MVNIVVSWEFAIAKWIRPHLPYCGPGLESQAHHTHYYIVKFWNKFVSVLKKDENKQKRPYLANIVTLR